jgi:hypothetical protein
MWSIELAILRDNVYAFRSASRHMCRADNPSAKSPL